MRIAFISDIHEDILSLEETLRKIEKLKVDEIICLGDISGYSIPYYKYLNQRNAHQCLSLIRSNCKYITLGNHDIHAAKILPKECTFFNYPENWYGLNYYERQEKANGILWLHEENDLDPLYKMEDINFLNTLPEYEIVDVSGYKTLLTHYVYPNISGLKKEFYTYQDEFRQHFDFMEKAGCVFSFTGHAHTKGFFVVDNRKYKQCRKKTFLSKTLTCIGIPPITSSSKKNGFCIFDSADLSVQLIKL